MKSSWKAHLLFVVCCFVTIECGHGSHGRPIDPSSKGKPEATPGDVPTILLNADCGHAASPIKTNAEERRLAIDSSIALLRRLHGQPIPTKNVREAVASGLPLVETVLGDGLKAIVGPDLRAKPFPAFARLTVGSDNRKLTCIQVQSAAPIEFVPIVVDWDLEGSTPGAVTKWLTEDQEIYNYGVRLDEHRGDIFFYLHDGMATEIGQAGPAAKSAP